MTSSSIFSSPFHPASHDPEAFGSYTSCQGPPAKPHVSPVTKFRRHIASTFAHKRTKRRRDFLRSEPFVPDILNLPFVAEEKSARVRACSASSRVRNPTEPPCRKAFEPLEPFDTDIVMLDFVLEDLLNLRQPNRKLRRIVHSTPLTETGQSASTTHLLGDDVSTPTMTSTIDRPATAAGEEKSVHMVQDSLGLEAISVHEDAPNAASLPGSTVSTPPCAGISTCQGKRLPDSVLQGSEASGLQL